MFARLLLCHWFRSPAASDELLCALGRHCPRLRGISLTSTRISDVGLQWLAGCSRLQMLNVAYCVDVGPTGLLLVAQACGWLREVTMCQKLRQTEAAELLEAKGCVLLVRDMDVDEFSRFVEYTG